MTLSRHSMTISHLPVFIIDLTATARKWDSFHFTRIHVGPDDFPSELVHRSFDDLPTSHPCQRLDSQSSQLHIRAATPDLNRKSGVI
jgi:hypothetical protein